MTLGVEFKNLKIVIAEYIGIALPSSSEVKDSYLFLVLEPLPETSIAFIWGSFILCLMLKISQ